MPLPRTCCLRYTAAELLSGVKIDGEGILWLDASPGATDYVLYLEHRDRSMEEKRRIPKKMVKGAPKPRPSRSAPKAPPPMAPPLEILEDDVNVCLRKLEERGYKATDEFAQLILDSLNSFMDTLNLVPSDTDSVHHIDQLGNKMHAILEKTKRIKLKMCIEAHSIDQLRNKALVCGVEGAGKSTLLNSITRFLAKLDAHLAAASPQTVVTQSFSRRFALEEPLDQAPIDAADALLKKFVFDPKANPNIRKMKRLKGDILPTGRGGSMTALVTNIRLDPTATAAKLSLTYHETSMITDVLALAEKLRDALRKVKADKEAGVEGAGAHA